MNFEKNIKYPRNILVTGATGFVGKYLVTALLENNYYVRIFVRNKEKARKMFGDNVEYIIGDISDEEKIRKSIENIDLIYHLAANRGENRLIDKEYYFKNNVLPTKLFCKYCAENKIKLIYLSSSGVNGWQKKLPIDESFPYEGQGLYHWSKIESEKEILSHIEKGLNATIVRSVIVYGNGDNGFLFKLINMIKAKRFLIIGDGKNRIHLLDVNNLTNGLLKILDNPGSGKMYYMADEYPISINDLVGTICYKLDINIPLIKIPLFFAYTVAFFLDTISPLVKIEFPISVSSVNILTKDRYYSIEKAKKELGFCGGSVKQYILENAK